MAAHNDGTILTPEVQTAAVDTSDELLAKHGLPASLRGGGDCGAWLEEGLIKVATGFATTSPNGVEQQGTEEGSNAAAEEEKEQMSSRGPPLILPAPPLSSAQKPPSTCTTKDAVPFMPPQQSAAAAAAAADSRSRLKIELLAFTRSSWASVLCLCICTLLWCVVEIFAPPPFGINTGEDGAECAPSSSSYDDFGDTFGMCICPRETICIKDRMSLIFLALARCSAYFDYPLYCLLFLSKAHNLRGFLQRSYLREFVPLDDLHHLHTLAGQVVGFEVTWHSFWHMLRWGLAGDIRFLYSHTTGITGLISLCLTPLIVFPMLVTRWRKKLTFELRKSLHYLSIVWGVVICFHAPKRHIGIIMGSSVGIYAADWLVGYFFVIHDVPTLQFTRLGQATEVVWENPPGWKSYESGAGYVYLCLPWISKREWHAFSLVSHPTLPGHSSVCMATVGDWTKAVHSALAKPSSRPGWIYGPFPSPFSTAVGYDNLITVASGIGITPSISTIVNLGSTRKVHLIWMCRDPDLIEYYWKTIPLEDDAWKFIFYTGKKRKLVLGKRPKSHMVMVILGRPDLKDLVISIIDNISNGTPIPSALRKKAQQANAELFNEAPTVRFADALERARFSYSYAQMFDIAMDASFSGVPLSPAQKLRIRILKSVSLLAQLTDCEIIGVANAMHVQCFAPGESIIREGERGERFYIINNGEVNCFKEKGGVETELARLSNQQYFGERALIKNEPRKASVSAVGKVECLVLERADFTKLLMPSANRTFEEEMIAREKETGAAAVSAKGGGVEQLRSSISFQNLTLLSTLVAPEEKNEADAITLEGFVTMIRIVMRDFEGVSDYQLEQYFKAADLSGTGSLTASELENMIDSIRAAAEREEHERFSGLGNLQKAESKKDGRPAFKQRRPSLKDMSSKGDIEAAVDNWQMMYCGGAEPVVKQLTDVHLTYNIPLKIESFAW